MKRQHLEAEVMRLRRDLVDAERRVVDLTEELERLRMALRRGDWCERCRATVAHESTRSLLQIRDEYW